MKIGEYNYLRVLRFTSVGVFLGDKDGNDILLPNKYVPERVSIDDEIKVFVYKDSEDRPIATNLDPLITVGKFASLKVTDVSTVGAFLDWGLEKDLLVPYREQKSEMEPGYWYLVHLYYDEESDRLVGTTKINDYFNEDTSSLSNGQEVEILVGEKSDLGFTVVINDEFKGLLYHNEIFQPIKLGQRHKAWIKNIREDGKVDLTLQPVGVHAIEPNAEIIINMIREKGGFLSLNDNSSPEEIYMLLKMSKKNFKKALGSLYKQRLVVISDEGVKLAE
ncbi:MAG: S1-like domain-containing RNA-binding protein [Bacteroidota bacterium]